MLGACLAMFGGEGLALAQTLRLLSPEEGLSSTDLIPTFNWDKTQADHLEFWLDGHCLEKLPGSATRYQPFPLAYGTHQWHLVAEYQGVRQQSETRQLTILGHALTRLPKNAILLREGWALQSSVLVGRDGASLSATPVDTQNWHTTSVPTTVLSALVRAGVYPNPYVALNNLRIPDADEVFNQKNKLLQYSHLPGRNPWSEPYWFLKSFTLPSSLAGKRLWLNFGELNYRAEVWLNGVKLAGETDLVGMDRRFRLELTRVLRSGTPNQLAVLVYPVDLPGEPAAPATTTLADPGRNMGEDGLICLNHTRWDAIGWDWQPAIRDRAMGLTEDVYLTCGGDLEIEDLYVAPQVELGEHPSAKIPIEVELRNHGTKNFVGRLEGLLLDASGNRIAFHRECTLAAGASTRLTLDPASIPALHLQKPRLWWPRALGEPHLYRLELQLVSRGEVLAESSTCFGVRKIETGLRDQVRFFRVNGRELFLQGGNWVNDMMYTWSAERYANEVALALAANLNFLRIWGPNGSPADAFFDEADRQGLLLQQDFLHDYWGTFMNRRGFNPELDLYLKASSDLIRRLRNHPSLFLWCGGNEGPNPREAYLTGTLLPHLDGRGQRPYLRSSDGDGLKGGGPYHNLLPGEYFTHPKLSGFNSEVGPSGFPEWESLEKFLDFKGDPQRPERFPLSGVWAYHDATDQTYPGDPRKFSTYDSLVRSTFGAPQGTDLKAAREYALKASLISQDAYQAAVEALGRGLGAGTSGFAIWKFNSSWPSLVWQITDWYQQANSGFYALRRAAEPVHAQLNRDTRTLALVNRTQTTFPSIHLKASLQDLAGNRLWEHAEAQALPAFCVRQSSVPVPVFEGLRLLKVEAFSAEGQTLSRNSYWLEAGDKLSGLFEAAPGALALDLERSSDQAVRVHLHNPGTTPVLNLRLKLLDGLTGQECLPSFWSDNYLTLFPGEKLDLTVHLRSGALPRDAQLGVEALNLAFRVLPLQSR